MHQQTNTEFWAWLREKAIAYHEQKQQANKPQARKLTPKN